MGARIGCMCVCRKFGLESEGQQSPRRNDRTCVKDTENLAQLRPPCSDCLFVILRVVTSGDCIPFTPLDNMLLYLSRGPSRELSKEIAGHAWLAILTSSVSRSPRGLVDRAGPLVLYLPHVQGLRRRWRRLAPVRRSPLWRPSSPVYISQRSIKIGQREAHSDHRKENAGRSEGDFG